MAGAAARAAGEALNRALVAAGAAAVVAAAVGTAVVFGFDTFVFAWVVHFALMAWAAVAIDRLRPRLDGRWFRVREWEPPLYRRLGVWCFMRALRAIGWERAMRGRRAFDGTRASLAGLDRDTRTSEAGHLVAAAVAAVLAVVGAAAGAWSAFGWLAGLTPVLHGWPVLLQRAVRHRAGRLLRRSPGA